MSFRRFVWITHRYCGLLIAGFLLLAAATGSLLVFRPELDCALNSDLYRAPARPVQSATQIVQIVQTSHPDWRIAGFDLATRPGRSLRLKLAVPLANVGGSDEVFVDPADGHVIGARASAAAFNRRGILEAIYLFHYTLLAGDAGRWFMGFVALLWLLLNAAGVLMTWPGRPPRLRHWMPAWGTSRNALGRRPWPEIHRVGGLWLLVFSTLMAYTSVAMNFYDEAFRPLVEAISPPRVSPFDISPPPHPETGKGIGFAAAEAAAIAAAEQRTPALRPVAITDDRARGFYDVSFAPGGTTLYENFGRVTYSVSGRDGHLVWIDQPRLDGIGRLVLRSLYPLHSGQIGGLATRGLVFLLGVLMGGLVITGVVPWLRRMARRAR